MLEHLRDTPAGQLLRTLGVKGITFPEERLKFEIPAFAPDSENSSIVVAEDVSPASLEKVGTTVSAIAVDDEPAAITRTLSKKGVADPIVVTWYKNDSENPRNWSERKKVWTMIVINLYTFVVYCGASIIAPTAEFVMKKYNVSQDVASLGLSMYVVGYGVGPMFLSPISEIPFVGRNPPYWASFILFFIVSVVMAVVDNFPAIIVLRFLQGLFGSPALASGAASIEDMYDMYEAPYGYIWWVAAMYCGPSFGPLLAGYAVWDTWRWALWEMVIMAGIVMVLLPFLPETWGPTILLKRAKRLRTRTGNPSYLASSELKPLNFGTTLTKALYIPIKIAVLDPAITYACVYCAVVYATYYSFFEAFPIVYMGTYGMSLGGMGLIFTVLSIGCIFGVAAYWVYLSKYFLPRVKAIHAEKGKPVEPEEWLKGGLIGVWGVPAGLLIFAWTAREDVHWVAPTAGIAVWAAFSFVVFQSIICYLPPVYPRYVASLFAANDFTRSTMAAGFVQFTRAMYVKLGINHGVTLLAGLSFLGVIGHYGLFYYGKQLRSRSKFTD